MIVSVRKERLWPIALGLLALGLSLGPRVPRRVSFRGSVAGVSGRVTTFEAAAVSGARVTITDTAGFFREIRSAPDGAFLFPDVPAGSYALGVSFPGLEYAEARVTIASVGVQASFSLGPETNVGRWDLLGDPGQAFGGSDSGVLLPDGRIIFCHDTKDPVIYDPAAGRTSMPPSSPTIQSCHAVTLLQDGRVIYVGGADTPVYGPGTRQVKTFDPTANTWALQPDLTDFRWYPSLAQLPDGELLAVGGGGLANPVRVNTSEIFDPRTMTWTRAGDVAIGNEVSPIVLLYTGDVLMTHRPPQIFSGATRHWRRAADFLQGNRMPNGDHSDHEIVLTPNGEVVAVGYKSFTPGVVGNFVEIYDPRADSWRLGANFAPVRSRPSTLLLPGGEILVMGGYKEDLRDPAPVNPYGYLALTDLYDPRSDSWRRLAPMNLAREYHAMPILVPDGRVVILGGEGAPGVEPPSSTLESFSPPYLFRGVRPEIRNFGTTVLPRGSTFTFEIEKTAAPTRVVLMSAVATTHFMDSGNARYLELEFNQTGKQITARVPSEPARAVLGYYMLVVLVDDIPSIARMVRIVPPAPALP